MGGQAVLTNTGMLALFKEIVLEATLNHPPSNCALEADETTNPNESPSHHWRDTSPCDEVSSWQEKGDSDHATPQPVCPLHEVYLFELIQIHTTVQHLELWAELVSRKLLFPDLLAEWWE
jgi:hypothetical protein